MVQFIETDNEHDKTALVPDSDIVSIDSGIEDNSQDYIEMSSNEDNEPTIGINDDEVASKDESPSNVNNVCNNLVEKIQTAPQYQSVKEGVLQNSQNENNKLPDYLRQMEKQGIIKLFNNLKDRIEKIEEQLRNMVFHKCISDLMKSVQQSKEEDDKQNGIELDTCFLAKETRGSIVSSIQKKEMMQGQVTLEDPDDDVSVLYTEDIYKLFQRLIDDVTTAMIKSDGFMQILKSFRELLEELYLLRVKIMESAGTLNLSYLRQSLRVAERELIRIAIENSFSAGLRLVYIYLHANDCRMPVLIPVTSDEYLGRIAESLLKANRDYTRGFLLQKS